MSKELKAIRNKISSNKSITLVGGAFDLLHPGHLHVLSFAKKLGDVLVVSVLSDKHIKGYKGKGRPVMSENYRLTMIEALKMIDYAFIADSRSYSIENLEILKPENLVFCKENDEVKIEKVARQKETILLQFPNIKFYDLERFYDNSISTTALVNKIKNL